MEMNIANGTVKLDNVSKTMRPDWKNDKIAQWSVNFQPNPKKGGSHRIHHDRI